LKFLFFKNIKKKKRPAWMGDGYVLPGCGATADFAVAATQQLACSRHWPSPGPSGSGKPDRFDRLPKKPVQIQISNKKQQFNRFPPVSRPVRPVYRSGLTGYQSV
jgi:hypothetical protein